MIYTVTLNPSLDHIVSVENFRIGQTNRAASELLVPGGKGINVSMVLERLGKESIALGFTAGFVGEEIARQLEQQGLRTDFIRVAEGVSRINIKLSSIEGTEINGQGPKIGRDAVEALLEKLDGLGDGDVLFLAGSAPASVPDDIYGRIAGRLSGRGVLLAVDATGALLTKTLEYHPFLVKPNHHELGELFGVTIGTRDEAIVYGRRLQEMGARNVLVSLAGEGAVLLAESGQTFQAKAPTGTVVNGTGAGDAMTAGFMAGWLDGGDYEKAFYRGVAAGSASAFSSHFPDAEKIENLYDQLLQGRQMN